MVPTKAYILRINTPVSIEYAKTCSDSCDSVGLPWQYVEGFTNLNGKVAWSKTGVKMPYRPDQLQGPVNKAECCSAGHGMIWKMIAEGDDECAIVLEHDALMLHPVDIDIPDNEIVVLGYKMQKPERYDHISAGPPKELIKIKGHEGAHAYAITKKTAQGMIEEIETGNNCFRRPGPIGCVDNAYFLVSRNTKFPISIVSPTPAIGWLRQSTIWNASSTKNYTFISSFANNLKS